MDSSGLESAKRTLFIVLAVDMAVTAGIAVFDLWAAGILEGVRAGTTVADPATISHLEFWPKFAGLAFLTLFGVGVALVRWIGAAYQYSRETLGASGFAQEKWKLWGWIVPFLNLFKPYQVLSEIYKAGTPDCVGDDWKKSSGSGWLLMWWVFWLLAHIVLMQIFMSAPKNGQFELDLTQSIAALNGGVLACVISLIVSGLWYLVVGSLSSRLLKRSFEVGASPAGLADFADTAPSGTTRAMTPMAVVDEEAIYAQVAHELETGSVDKGLWTRLLAQTDGDEKRTKVLYIKQRAERLLGPRATPAPAIKHKPTAAAKPSPTGMSIPAWALTIFGSVMVLGIVLAVVLPAMQGKRTVQLPPAKPGQSEPGMFDDLMPSKVQSPPAKPSQSVKDFLKDAPNAPYVAHGQIDPKDPLGLFAKPSFDSEGWTQDSTGSTEVGPWLKYDPPGTRYWRDANRIIYRVFPPGTKPNAEKANPFGLNSSEDFPR